MKAKALLSVFVGMLGLLLVSCPSPQTSSDDSSGSTWESSGSGSGSGSSGGGSSSGYTFYKKVSALKLTIIDSHVSGTSTVSIDLYKNGSKCYYKYSSSGYASAHFNTDGTYLGVSVSRYNYWSLRLVSTVTYMYYYNL